MKKNKMMRLASGLLVAVLITTSTISGTFAKYVTTADAKDEARVAKFGVVITATGSEDVFKKAYDGTVEAATVAGVQDKVVAPGTKNETGMGFAITGTPEVDVKVTAELTKFDGTAFAASEVPEEVFLKAGTYPDVTTAKTGDEFTIDDDYYPVVFTLKYGTDVLKTGTLDEIKTELTSFEKTFDANEDLSAEFSGLTLTWEWAFGTAGAPNGDDFADTLLGDIAAGAPTEAASVAAEKYNLTTDFAIKVIVEQID